MNGPLWSYDDTRYLLASAGVEPVERIAAKLGRSASACNEKLRRETGRGMRAFSGLLTGSEAARLCGRCESVIWWWRLKGLVTTKASVGISGNRMLDPFDLQEFLLSHRNILAGLDPFARRRIGLTVYDVSEIEAEQRKEG